MKTLLLTLIVMSIHASSDQTDSVSEMLNMVLRPDGKYDVTCKNGMKEIVTLEQIQKDQVCGTTTEVPVPTSGISALFSKSITEFYVLCKDQTWVIADTAAIQGGKVCNKIALLASEKLTTLRNREFFRVQVKGKMTDLVVFQSCKDAGLTVPCYGDATSAYSDELCSKVGWKGQEGEGFIELSRAICGMDSPQKCDALNDVFQYMGKKYRGGSACGVVKNEWWCAPGNSYQDRFALCVR